METSTTTYHASSAEVNLTTTTTTATTATTTTTVNQKKNKKTTNIGKSKAKLKVKTTFSPEKPPVMDGTTNSSTRMLNDTHMIHSTTRTTTMDDTTTTTNTAPTTIPHILSNEEYTSKSSQYMIDSNLTFDSAQTAPPNLQQGEATTAATTAATAVVAPSTPLTTPLSSDKSKKHHNIMKTKIFPEKGIFHKKQKENQEEATTISSANNTNANLHTPKTLYNSIKLRRLDELKRHQQLQQHMDHHHHHQDNNNNIQQSLQEFFLTPNNFLTSPVPMNNNNNNNIHPHSPLSVSSPSMSMSSPNSSNSENGSRSSNNYATATWESTRPVLIEDKLMTFIDKSPMRISFLVLCLIGLIYLMLAYDTTTTTTTATTSTASSATSTTIINEDIRWKDNLHGVWQTFFIYVNEIFITNMKIIIFAISYGVTLDLILITALDTIDIPIIDMRRGNIVASDPSREGEEKSLLLGEVKRLFQNDEKDMDENDHHSHGQGIHNNQPNQVIRHERNQKRKRPKNPVLRQSKNPVLRQFAIENIRKATSFIVLYIVSCGLVKGTIYKVLNTFISSLSYLHSSVGFVQDIFATEFMEGIGILSSPSGTFMSIFSITYVMALIVQSLEFMMKLPIQFLGIVLNLTIGNLFYYTGISWIWNKFISSVIASSSESICDQSLAFIQVMMMNIGIFLLAFYLVLVQLYPEKKNDEGQVGSNSSKSENRNDGLKED